MKKTLYLTTRQLVYIIFSIAVFIFMQSCTKFDNSTLNEEYAGKPVQNIVKNPLYIPPVVSPANLTLEAKEGLHDLGGGAITKVWQYNGGVPGPTIKANIGNHVSALFQNSLNEESIIHWHGMLVNHENDGHPCQAIPGDSSYAYNYQIINRAALNWYHPHPHMLTGKQVYNGLAGAFIINDAEESALNLPSGNYEIPLVLRDATLDQYGNLQYKPTSGGFFGKFPLVNGTRNPYLNVYRTMYRFRILIGSNSRLFGLSLNNGSFILIGNDGGLLPASSVQQRIDLSPGERLDVLIDFRQYTSGTRIMLKDMFTGWDLLEFRVGENYVSYNGAVNITSSIQSLSNPVKTRFFSFDGMSKINGKVYNMDRIDFTVPFAQTELWQFKTNGNGPHPVHVHGASFQVVSRIGGRAQVFPWERGWKDVVLVNDGETVNVLIRFDAYRGVYLMHCHKLEHEDMGMMSNFEVVEP